LYHVFDLKKYDPAFLLAFLGFGGGFWGVSVKDRKKASVQRDVMPISGNKKTLVKIESQ